jgi:hypothetical protein
VNPIEKADQNIQIYPHPKFDNIWSKARLGFVFYKSEQVGIKEKCWFNGLGPAHRLQCMGRFKPIVAPPISDPRTGETCARPLVAVAIKPPRCWSSTPMCGPAANHRRIKASTTEASFPPFPSLFPTTKVSRHVEPPFVNSSRLAYLCDLVLPLPQVSSLESSSFALPDASRTYRR